MSPQHTLLNLLGVLTEKIGDSTGQGKELSDLEGAYNPIRPLMSVSPGSRLGSYEILAGAQQRPR